MATKTDAKSQEAEQRSLLYILCVHYFLVESPGRLFYVYLLFVVRRKYCGRRCAGNGVSVCPLDGEGEILRT